jgi:O-antigen/teichoic acid export membrane protein
MNAAPSTRPRTAAFLAHVRLPLYRDGYALVLNAGVSAALGVGFWLLAAREYPATVLGIDTAAISAMMFLSGVAQLNLMSTLVRWVPVLAGDRRRFIGACYLLTALLAAGCAAIFLLGLGLWSPALRGLHRDPAIALSFIAAAAAWCIFNLQDSALTGLGSAVLVPVDNTIYGIAKIAILVALVTASPHWGIYGAWIAGLAPSVLIINWLIFGRLGRRPATGEHAHTPALGVVARFAAPDYVSQLFSLGAVTLMPVIVVAISGARVNADYALAWMISQPLLLLSTGPAQSLVVAGSADPGRLAEYARKVLIQGLWLTVPAAAIVGVGSHWLLLLFGHGYSVHAALTLSLLAVASVPSAVFSVYVSVCRVQRRMRNVVGTVGLLCGLVLVLGPLLLSQIGIKGLGIAWLVAETVTATGILVLDRPALGLGRRVEV